MIDYKSKVTYRLKTNTNSMSTTKKIIENLEKQIGVPNAFGSQDLEEKKPYQDLLDAVEHDEIDWEHERNMELENDHEDELE